MLTKLAAWIGLPLVSGITEKQGHVTDPLPENFNAAGYNEGSLVDVVMVIGDKIITNYMYALTAVPVDFPVAPGID